MEKRENLISIGMFDFCRGLLMVLVILWHSISLFFHFWEIDTTQWWSVLLLPAKLLVYGTVPAFFVISGFSVRKQSVLKCLKSNMKYYIRAFYITGFIVVIATVIKNIIVGRDWYENGLYYGVPLLLGINPGRELLFNKINIFEIGPSWFLMTMAVSLLAFNIIIKIEDYFVQLIICLTLAGLAINVGYRGIIPFCILQAMCCLTYIWVGYNLKKNGFLLTSPTRNMWTGMVLVLLLSVPFGYIDISQNVWQKGMVDYMGSVVAGYLFTRLLMNWCSYNGKIVNIFARIGRYSLYILCVHTIEYLVFPWERITILSDNLFFDIVVVFVLRIMVVYAGVKMIVSFKRMRGNS